MAGSPPNLHKLDSRSACIQDVLKVKVKVKGHVIRALFCILGMSYSVIDGLVMFYTGAVDWTLHYYPYRCYYVHFRFLHDGEIKYRSTWRPGNVIVSDENIRKRHCTIVLLSHVDQRSRQYGGAHSVHLLTTARVRKASDRYSRRSRNQLGKSVRLSSRGHLPAGICRHTWAAVFIRHRGGRDRATWWSKV